MGLEFTWDRVSTKIGRGAALCTCTHMFLFRVRGEEERKVGPAWQRTWVRERGHTSERGSGSTSRSYSRAYVHACASPSAGLGRPVAGPRCPGRAD